jgi:hypothetical protein
MHAMRACRPTCKLLNRIAVLVDVGSKGEVNYQAAKAAPESEHLDCLRGVKLVKLLKYGTVTE